MLNSSSYLMQTLQKSNIAIEAPGFFISCMHRFMKLEQTNSVHSEPCLWKKS